MSFLLDEPSVLVLPPKGVWWRLDPHSLPTGRAGIRQVDVAKTKVPYQSSHLDKDHTSLQGDRSQGHSSS